MKRFSKNFFITLTIRDSWSIKTIGKKMKKKSTVNVK